MPIAENNAVLVSVAIPVYNGEKYLTEAIDSILAQTLTDFELIVIDDGSTDGSLQILRKYEQIDARIRVVTRENRGVVATRNELIDIARGKWIAWMDQDDISLPERLERQVELMDAQAADICGCHWLVVNGAGKLTDAKLVPLNKASFAVYIACTVPFAHGSVMMRASFIQAHGLRYGRAKFAEDYGLWIRFWDAGAIFANVDQFLFTYRDTSGTFSKKTKKENALDSKILRRSFVNKNPDDCLYAIRKLTESYEDLSQLERVYLLLASYLVSISTKRLILIDVFKRSASKSIGIALLYLFKGV